MSLMPYEYAAVAAALEFEERRDLFARVGTPATPNPAADAARRLNLCLNALRGGVGATDVAGVTAELRTALARPRFELRLPTTGVLLSSYVDIARKLSPRARDFLMYDNSGSSEDAALNAYYFHARDPSKTMLLLLGDAIEAAAAAWAADRARFTPTLDASFEGTVTDDALVLAGGAAHKRPRRAAATTAAAAPRGRSRSRARSASPTSKPAAPTRKPKAKAATKPKAKATGAAATRARPRSRSARDRAKSS